MEIVKGEGTEATRTRLHARRVLWEHHTWLHDVITGDPPEGVTEEDLAMAGL